jgi:hypothetical protein
MANVREGDDAPFTSATGVPRSLRSLLVLLLLVGAVFYVSSELRSNTKAAAMLRATAPARGPLKVRVIAVRRQSSRPGLLTLEAASRTPAR